MVPTPPRVPSSCRSLLAMGQLLSLVFRSSLTLLPGPCTPLAIERSRFLLLSDPRWACAFLSPLSRVLPEALGRAQAGGRRSRVNGQLFVVWALRAPGQQAVAGSARKHVARAKRHARRRLVRRALGELPLDQAVLERVIRQGREPAA